MWMSLRAGGREVEGGEVEPGHSWEVHGWWG